MSIIINKYVIVYYSIYFNFQNQSSFCYSVKFLFVFFDFQFDIFLTYVVMHLKKYIYIYKMLNNRFSLIIDILKKSSHFYIFLIYVAVSF